VAYATETDLTNTGLSAQIVGQLTTAQVTAYLAESSSVVDSYLRGRYSVPLTTVPESIRKATVNLAACDILQTLGYKPEEYDAGYKARCEKTLEWLKDISAGRASLGDVDDTVIHEGAARVYTSTPRGW